MNVAFFLVPKEQVIYLTPEATMRQALEKMDYHGYTAVPIIDQKGRYISTLTEGDLLRKIKEQKDMRIVDTDHVKISEIEIRKKHNTVSISAEMEDLISLAVEQNFVPVIDDKKVFIGIIRRREIIEYCYTHYLKEKNFQVNN